MLPSLPELQTAWAAEFPGTSVLLVVLRAALALADWQARHIQAQFQQFHHELYLTGLPMSYWDPLTHSTYRLIQRHNALAQREFRHALRALQSSYKKPDPVPPPPPPPEPPGKITFPQSLVITVDNEIVKTTAADVDAAFICAPPPDTLEIIGWFTRQYHFASRIVPDCYAHLLTHKGATYQPKLGLNITYRKEDFLRFCQQELETGATIPLDDPDCRCGYIWTD